MGNWSRKTKGACEPATHPFKEGEINRIGISNGIGNITPPEYISGLGPI